MTAGRPTTAFVLAAGKGLRMRPLTNDRPKPLVVLRGRTLLDHVLDRLAAAGIERAVVNVHYKGEQIIEHVAARTSPAICISDERDALLDTGGGVVRALPLIGAQPFIIHNSDSTWLEGIGSNLARLIQAFDPDRMDSLMLLAATSASLGYEGPGDFAMDQMGTLRRRREREIVPFAFTGVSIAHPRLFAGATDGAFSLNRLWDRAMADGRLFGLRLQGLWMHVGTPEALADAEGRLAVLAETNDGGGTA